MADEPRLERKLGLATATFTVVANMVGTGIFILSGPVAAQMKEPLLSLLAWLAGGGIALCGALTYAELAVAMPRAGGEYVFLREIYGRGIAFLSGWISLVAGFSAPIAAGALAFSRYLAAASDSFAALDVRWPALLAVLALTAVHARGLGPGAFAQNLLTAFKVLGLATFVVLGLGFGEGSFARPAAASRALPGASDVGTALVLVSFAYSGWNAAAYLGGEVRDPARILPRSLLLGTAFVTLLYVAINVVYVYARPGVGEGSAALEVMAASLFGEGVSGLVSLLAAIGLLSTVSAMILTGPRVYYAMACDGLFPSFAARVHPRWKAPVRAIGVQAGLACAFVLWGRLESLVAYVGWTLSLFLLLTVGGVFLFRRRQGAGRRGLRYGWVPLAFVLPTCYVLVSSLAGKPREALAGIVTLLVGLGLYQVREWSGRFRSKAARSPRGK